MKLLALTSGQRLRMRNAGPCKGQSLETGETRVAFLDMQSTLLKKKKERKKNKSCDPPFLFQNLVVWPERKLRKIL